MDVKQEEDGEQNHQAQGGGGGGFAGRRSDDFERYAPDFRDPETGRELCKNYLKEHCNRGRQCPYIHPKDVLAERIQRHNLSFCRDFLNGRGCSRERCRFLHITKPDELKYKETGQVSEQMAMEIMNKGQGNKDNIAGAKLCLDYVRGRCDRGSNRCRFLHVNAPGGGGGGGGGGPGPGPGPVGPGSHGGPPGGAPWNTAPPAWAPNYGSGGYDHGPEKRMRMDGPPGGGQGGVPGYGPPGMPGGSSSEINALKEENMQLMQKVARLGREVEELTRERKELADEVARLRGGGAPPPAPSAPYAPSGPFGTDYGTAPPGPGGYGGAGGGGYSGGAAGGYDTGGSGGYTGGGPPAPSYGNVGVGYGGGSGGTTAYPNPPGGVAYPGLGQQAGYNSAPGYR